jgi:YVTN family beta-propeller protein
MTNLTRSIALASLWILMTAPHSSLMAQAGKLLVFQNAMAGDAVTIIDTETNRAIGEIPDIEIANGLATSPDGSRLYVTGEVAKTLYVVDTETMEVINEVHTTGRPAALDVSKDGRRIYVGVQDQGATGLNIYDAATLTLVKNLPLEGMRTHYVLVTPDGKYVAVTANQGRSAEEALTVRLRHRDRGVRAKDRRGRQRRSSRL